MYQTYNTPKPTRLLLTLSHADCARSNGSPCQFASRDFHAMLALFAGSTRMCNVYSPTNVSFYAYYHEIMEAWDNLDKERYWWVTAEDVAIAAERFGDGPEGRLAMSLPNLFIEETPANIADEMRVQQEYDEMKELDSQD